MIPYAKKSMRTFYHAKFFLPPVLLCFNRFLLASHVPFPRTKRVVGSNGAPDTTMSGVTIDRPLLQKQSNRTIHSNQRCFTYKKIGVD